MTGCLSEEGGMKSRVGIEASSGIRIRRRSGRREYPTREER